MSVFFWPSDILEKASLPKGSRPGTMKTMSSAHHRQQLRQVSRFAGCHPGLNQRTNGAFVICHCTSPVRRICTTRRAA
jgi:hypothetical protein